MKQVFPMDSRVTYDAEGRPSYDRAVSSKPLRSLIRKLFTTGVMPNPSDTCQVRAGGDGMTLIVSPGLAVLEGGLYLEDAARTLSVTAADPTFDRIDTVVLRWNENDAVRDCDLHVVAGVPAKNPVRPALTREGSIYEIGLADIFVTKGVATITNEKITDTRMESARCGIVSSVSEFDTTTIYQQIQGELAKFKSDEEVAFSEWFDYMKDQLTEDAAGRLQTEVDDVRGQIHTNLLNPPIGTTTIRGITFTSNGDGTYTANGTATGEIWFNFIGEKKPISYFDIKNDGTEYRFTGCPDGGSSTTYMVNVYTYTDETPEHLIKGYTEIGNGQTFSLGSTETQIGFGIRVKTNTVLDNVVFKPMLTTDTSSDYDSFTEYSGDKKRLNEQVADLHKKSKGLTTNLLEPSLKNTTTANGVTCTANGDGTFVLNGTATARTYFNLTPAEQPASTHWNKLNKGTYKITSDKYANASLLRLQVGSTTGATYTNTTFEIAEDNTPYKIYLMVENGQTVTNLTFKPMLTTDLDATYNDYVPYSGDGRLNENVAALFDKVEEHETTIGNHTREIAQVNADLSELSESEVLLQTSTFKMVKCGKKIQVHYYNDSLSTSGYTYPSTIPAPITQTYGLVKGYANGVDQVLLLLVDTNRQITIRGLNNSIASADFIVGCVTFITA